MKIEEELLEKDGEDEAQILYPEDLKGFEIGIRESQFSVFEILRRYQKGQVILNESFQRNFVWNKKQMSRFIESLLLDLPIPPLYFNQTIENEYIVVDGLNRLSTLVCFLEKMKDDDDFQGKENFKLEGLEGLSYLNGKTYDDLAEYIGYQARIEDKNLNTYIIKPSVKLPIIYDIFDRINTGGTKLNRQEVRNALRGGRSSKLLRKLAQKPYFLEAIDNGISDKRLKAQETVLRILSFMIFDHQKDYNGNISDFLDRSMDRINKMPEQEIEFYEQGFERIMKRSFQIFSINNFRLKKQDGSRTAINLAVMDSVCHFIHSVSDEFLTSNKTRIQENYNTLQENSDYSKVTKQATGDKKNVTERFHLAKQILSQT